MSRRTRYRVWWVEMVPVRSGVRVWVRRKKRADVGGGLNGRRAQYEERAYWVSYPRAAALAVLEARRRARELIPVEKMEW